MTTIGIHQNFGLGLKSRLVATILNLIKITINLHILGNVIVKFEKFQTVFEFLQISAKPQTNSLTFPCHGECDCKI